MRVLLLPRYEANGASSRYRLWQYVPLLEREGVHVEVWPLHDESYLEHLYQTGGRRLWRLLRDYGERWKRLRHVDEFDGVVCEQELLPFLPAAVEEPVLRRSLRFVVDYDDAAYVKYTGWPVLKNKIQRLLARATAVVVGNGHLANYARRYARNVFVIPSVVNLDRYPRRQERTATSVVRVAWIGTPVTAHLLRPLLGTLGRLCDKHPDLVLRLIGAGRGFSPDGLRYERMDWSEQTEAGLLAESDIGIMPLPEGEFARGKCGVKLLQYMAAGLPVVASPVGANPEIVQENLTGFLAASEAEWFARLDELIQNHELRQRIGKAGRARVEAHYTLERGLAQWLEVLKPGSVPDIATALARPRPDAREPLFP